MAARRGSIIMACRRTVDAGVEWFSTSGGSGRALAFHGSTSFLLPHSHFCEQESDLRHGNGLSSLLKVSVEMS